MSHLLKKLSTNKFYNVSQENSLGSQRYIYRTACLPNGIFSQRHTTYRHIYRISNWFRPLEDLYSITHCHLHFMTHDICDAILLYVALKISKFNFQDHTNLIFEPLRYIFVLTYEFVCMYLGYYRVITGIYSIPLWLIVKFSFSILTVRLGSISMERLL